MPCILDCPFLPSLALCRGLGAIPMSKRMVGISETGATSLLQLLGSIPKNRGLTRSSEC